MGGAAAKPIIHWESDAFPLLSAGIYGAFDSAVPSQNGSRLKSAAGMTDVCAFRDIFHETSSFVLDKTRPKTGRRRLNVTYVPDAILVFITLQPIAEKGEQAA